jgi:hypothetical protein
MFSRRRLPARERIHLLIEDVYALVCVLYARIGLPPPLLN